MKNLDLYWMTNDKWLEFREDHFVLKEDAPPKAKESYKHYLEQTKSDE